MKRVYLQPSRVVYKGMCDLMDTQRGVEISDEYTRRAINFNIIMFDTTWALQFAAVPIDATRCEVALTVNPETPERYEDLLSLADSVLRREYAMLDAMLLIGTPLEVKYEGGN